MAEVTGSASSSLGEQIDLQVEMTPLAGLYGSAFPFVLLTLRHLRLSLMASRCSTARHV